MADVFTADQLDRGRFDFATSLEDLKIAGADLAIRQNRINEEVGQYITAGGGNVEGLQAQIDTINGQIVTIQNDITAIENDLNDLQDYQIISVSAVGNQSVGPNGFLGVDFTLGAGSGTYTYELVLTGSIGSQVHVLVRTPASAGRVLNVRNATAGGTILATATSTSVARVWTGIFIHNGTAFVKHLFTTL